MFDAINQVAIVVLSGSSVILFASGRGRIRRWGYVVGLASEPSWIYAGWASAQWGVVIMAVWWAVFYAVGARNNWRVE